MIDMQKRSDITAVARRALALVLLLALLSGGALADAIKASVYSESMTVYKKASTSSTKLGSLNEGTNFYIIAYNSSWAKIYYKGYTGYARLKDMELVNRIKAYTTADVAVYKSASASSKRLGTVERGTLAYVAGRNGSYYMVQNKSGSITGYIHEDYLSSKKPAEATAGGSSGSSSSASNDSRTIMPSSLKSKVTSYKSSLSNSQKLEYVIYVAQNQLGKSYSTNPSSPKTFDCAGLVKYCYKQANISVESSAYGQGYDDSYTKISSTSDLKRGDMVCFNTVSSDSDLSDHTGIYIGSGKFIHASSAAGKVIVSDLSSGYYSTTFSWGLRILE